MGDKIFDQYFILHMASGIIAYFFGISFNKWFALHILFEYIENTKIGINVIDNYFWFWPGGKIKADSIINNIGDQIAAVLGWKIAEYLDNIYKKIE